MLTALVFAALSAPASANVTCIVEDGGLPVLPQGNVLTVGLHSQDDLGRVVRSGDTLKVYDDENVHIPCGRSAPTVEQIDKITFAGDPVATESLGILDLGGGQFAPGATDEGDGSSEIEVDLALDGGGSYFLVEGSSGSDELRFGRNETVPGGNLNPREDGPTADVDVTVVGAGLAVEAGAGHDLVTAAGGPAFDAPLAKRSVFFVGGKGNDTLIGGRTSEVLVGGPGRDVMRAREGDDLLVGGPGADLLVGGAGGDELNSYGGGRDRVACGSGRDLAFSDRRDRISGCEDVLRFSGFGFF